MENVREWIKTAIITLAFLISASMFFYGGCATKAEIHQLANRIDRMDNRIDKRLDRIENKLDRNSQNFLEHFKNHK